MISKLFLFSSLSVLGFRANLLSQVDTGKEVKFEKNQSVLFSELANLAIDEKRIGNWKISDSIAKIYEINYLDTVNDSVLFKPVNILFVTEFLELMSSSNRVFALFYKSPALADEIIGARKGYAKDVVKYIIQKEDIDTYLYKEDKFIVRNPNWDFIFKNIARKYNQEYAQSLVPAAEFTFYKKTENWKKYAVLFEKEVRERPPTPESNCLGGGFGDSWTLNITAWDMFLHCSDRSVLKMAVKWSDLSISLCKTEADAVQYYDTKANLLYKMGLQPLALKYEQMALSLSQKDKEYLSNLEKMRRGIPTWPVE